MTYKKQRSYYYGHLCEWLTVILLFFKGYLLQHSRYKTASGEIDLILKRGRTLLFVEVKARHDGLAAEAITPRQQQRIAHAARLYIAKYPEFVTFTLRFDAVLWRGLRCQHLKNAWHDI